MKGLTRHPGVLGVYSCYYCARVENPLYVESLLHALFAEYRYQNNREFFTITPEKAKLAFLLIESHNLPDRVEEVEESIEDQTKLISKRTKPFSFEEIGIEIGESVYYYSNPEIKARVVSVNRVEFEGTEYALSNLTGILDEWRITAYQGPLYWAYNGERLTEIRKKKTTSF
jgi:hypothetical protein